jgi:signal transduction histidine kinase
MRDAEQRPHVNPYFLLPLATSLACLAFGVVVWTRDREATSNRCAAALMIGPAWWGICEALWTLAPDAATAEFFLRASAPGWVAVGPTCMHLFLAQERRSRHGLRRLLRAGYAIAGGFLVVAWAEPLWNGHAFWLRMDPVPWGWSYHAGFLYPYWYAFTVATSSTGIVAAYLEMRHLQSPAELEQRPLLSTGLGVPLLIGSTTDGLLPSLGIEFPRLGVASFAVFGALITWSLHKYGFSVLAPSGFAGNILEALPEGVALATGEGRVRAANPALARLLGVDLPTLAGIALRDILPGLSLEELGWQREREAELATATGTVPIALSASPLRDKQGAPIGVVLVMRDLREVVALRARLITSARLAAVGELAAGIAHEINNPLAYIGANLRALREHWSTVADAWRADVVKEDVGELLAEGGEMLDDSLEGVERAAAIVRDVRAFSHGGGDAAERFDVNELLERALRVANPHLRNRIRVVRELGDVGLVEGARREVEQVLLNLIVNAAQAIHGAGELRVRTALEDGEVSIRFTDTGSGIAPELVGRVFDPFFTTKPVGEGTGLGLSISHEIVRRHGGRIDVRSEPGRGAEFTVRLPAAEADALPL